MAPAPNLQLPLDLGCRPALDAEDFLVSAANRTAVDLIDSWPQWPHWAVLVVAPAQAGKSHLAQVWRQRSQAKVIEASALREASPAALSGHHVVVENLHAGIGNARALFHLLNLAREHKLALLATSQEPAGALDVALPDLRSRLRALPHVEIAAPDEMLLRGVLVKHFVDRQLTVEPAVVEYLMRRMDRSFAEAARLARLIDEAALAGKRRVTRALVAHVLAHAGGNAPLGEIESDAHNEGPSERGMRLSS